jgi:hypothetical protein
MRALGRRGNHYQGVTRYVQLYCILDAENSLVVHPNFFPKSLRGMKLYLARRLCDGVGESGELEWKVSEYRADIAAFEREH